MKVAGILKHPAFGLVIVGALLGVLTTVLATHTHDIHGFEKQLLLGVYNWSLIWIMPMIVLTQGGNLWAIILLTLVAFGRRRDTVWLKLAAAGLLASLMATILKNIVMSVRPVELGIGVVARFPWSVGYAFPSGHTAIATALAVIIFASVKRSHRWWALLLPVLVGLSRLYLGVHRPLDLAGGLAVGLVSGGLVLLLSENLKIKIPKTGVQWGSTLGQFLRTGLAQLLIGMALLAVLSPHFHQIDESLTVLKHADGLLVYLAILVIALSFPATALTYFILTRHRVELSKLTFVQLASVCANRLLPSGTGSLTVNSAYLRRRNFTLAEATAISSTNNLLGLFASSLLLVTALLVTPHEATSFHTSTVLRIVGVVLVIMGIFGLILLRSNSKSFLAPLKRFIRDFIGKLAELLKSPVLLLQALLSSLVVALCFATCLWLCLMAVGVNVSGGQALVAVSLGVAVGAVIPTPGGLGGVEAGISAALVAMGVRLDMAVAGVLLYRLVSFWLPILPSYIALRRLQSSL